ncbi:DUF2771 family protein [Jatrophihabitans sp.]|uniref:DUF2771 family protein n=1 Tax=Jatrophihabitans sp. TaxID=1932789 RepID=UPI0030C74448|nr:hypothetical protein [Jatrophihabitans sp.]
MRRARALATAVVGIGAVASLAACTKPLPNVTVLSGDTTVVVKPQAYCADQSHCHFPKGHVSTIKAAAGSSILVDVPRAVASKSWTLVSAVQKSNGTFQTISGANYQSGTVKNSHSTRVDVPYGVGSYFLVVTQKSATTNGSWVAEVSIKH